MKGSFWEVELSIVLFFSSVQRGCSGGRHTQPHAVAREVLAQLHLTIFLTLEDPKAPCKFYCFTEQYSSSLGEYKGGVSVGLFCLS